MNRKISKSPIALLSALLVNLSYPAYSNASTTFNAPMPELNCHMRFVTTTPRVISHQNQMVVGRVIISALANTPGAEDQIPDPKKKPAQMPNPVIEMTNKMLGNAYAQTGDLTYRGLRVSSATWTCP